METATKVFMLTSLLITWAPGFVVSAMKRKGEQDNLATPASIKTVSTDRVHRAWTVFYMLWAIIVVLFVFNEESINWFGSISILDTGFVKVFAIGLTCLGYYLPVAIAIRTLSKSIHDADNLKAGKLALITTGIYSYSRNPMYLAISMGVVASFLMIPSIVFLFIALGMIVIFYAISLDEEKRLAEIYGKAYSEYRDKVGLIFPKIESLLSRRSDKNV
jgi:protein-S-isoprenylcysteine O-methyltransferase Ste14